MCVCVCVGMFLPLHIVYGYLPQPANLGRHAPQCLDLLFPQDYIQMLMPPLIQKWNALKDEDKDLFPLLEVRVHSRSVVCVCVCVCLCVCVFVFGVGGHVVLGY